MKKGDVPYNSMRMWQGAVGISEYDGIVSPAYTVLEPIDNANGKFFMELFKKESSLQIFQRWSQGLTSDTWNLKYPALSTIEFYVPSVVEQNQIGAYFEQIDTLITLHQRKITFTRHISIYVWEQRKLAELAEINPKCTLPDSFEYVDLESVVGTEILSHRTESKETAPSRAQRLAQEGDVFYQTVRPYQKNNCIFEKPENNWVFSTGYAQMRPVNDGYFLLSLLQNEAFVKVVLDRCTGTSYPTINANDLAEIDVSFPYSSEEQKKIGDYFRKIDTLITLHQCKLKNSVFIEQNDWEQRKLNEIAQKVTEKNRDNLYDEPFTNSAEQG